MPIVIGCSYYLAYRTIFTREMFCLKIKLDVFFLPGKPEMSPGEWWWVSLSSFPPYDLDPNTQIMFIAVIEYINIYI